MALREDIEARLRAVLAPTALEVHDDSAAHAGHAAPGAHVRVVVVSPAFAGKTPLQRHRMVNDAVRDLLDTGTVHALQIAAKTPSE